MNYDISILYTREDATFVKSIAKGLEKINVSVLYKESLSRPGVGQTGLLRSSIENSLSEAYHGIIVISKSFIQMGYEDEDLDFLYQVLFMDNQILHSIWYNVSRSEVSSWYSKLALGIALQCPPETVDSVARKFQIKLAGSSKLQHNTLTGFHAQIQYIPPKNSTYRPQKSSTSDLQLPTQRTFQLKESNVSSVGETKEEMDLTGEMKDAKQATSIDDEPIAACFDDDLREAIRKRLDVYLTTLSNWKDLAAVFRISSATELKRLLDTKQPTLSLLEVLAQLDVTVGEFKHACNKIGRYDITDCLDSHLGHVKLP